MDINLAGDLWGMPFSLIGKAVTDTSIIAAISALGAIFGALAGGLATYIIEKSKIKNLDAQRRQQIYSQLYGRKIAYVQCYISYFMNFIALEKSYALRDFSLRIPERITLNGIQYSTNGIGFDQEVTRVLLEKSDNFSQRLAQSAKDLWEIVGLVNLLFSNVDDIIKDIKGFDKKFETFEKELKQDQESGLINFEYELLPHGKLDINTLWPKTKEATFQKDYINKLDGKFDDLLGHLENEIKREFEDAKKKHWWQLWK